MRRVVRAVRNAFALGLVASVGVLIYPVVTSSAAPAPSGCSEDSFLGGAQTPPPGGTITLAPGQGATVSIVYHDETPINLGATDPTKAPTYTLTDAASQVIASGTPTVTPTTAPPGTHDNFNSLLGATVPAATPTGDYTMTIKAWDSDQNKPGGDCGVATWSFHVLAPPPPPVYTCLAPGAITTTTAVLKGSTTDANATAAVFNLTPAPATAPTAAVSGGSAQATATALTPGTSYTYTVTFTDGATTLGTGSATACAFTTSAVLAETVTPTTTTTIKVKAAAPAAPAVLGAQEARPERPAELARTGIDLRPLVALGGGLMLGGTALMAATRRRRGAAHTPR